MSDTAIVALVTAIGAIIAALVTLRGAAKTAQPSAQEALNAGFTALTERQLGELLQMRTEVTGLVGKVAELEVRLTEVSSQLSLSQRVIGAAVSFIDRLVEWGQAGGTDPMPTPPAELHVHLNHPRWRASSQEENN